jgi:cysteinyl-tRNA synthetase
VISSEIPTLSPLEWLSMTKRVRLVTFTTALNHPPDIIISQFTDGQALVKLVSPEELQRARDEKRAAAEAKAAKKAAAAEAERQKKLQRLEKGKLPPTEMFKPPNMPEGTYSSWNDDGLPVTDGEGKELSKNAVKKAVKDQQQQKKLHEEYLKWVAEESR